MADEQDWAKEREDDLRNIEAARRKHNEELNDSWFGRRKREREATQERDQERENERVREGREHHDDELRERMILARLAAVLERLAAFLEAQGGTGAKLHFKLLKQGDTTMATVNIVSIQRVGGTVGVATDAPHGLAVGQQATIAGVSDSSFNGTGTLDSAPDATHFTFPQAGADSSVLVGGTVAAAAGGTGGGGTGGTGTVGTPSVYGVTVQDQNGATQPLPAGVTPAASVTGGDGTASASLSSDNATLTINYKSAGTYTIMVQDPSGKVQSGTATETVAAGTGGGGTLQFVLNKQAATGGATAASLRR